MQPGEIAKRRAKFRNWAHVLSDVTANSAENAVKLLNGITSAADLIHVICESGVENQNQVAHGQLAETMHLERVVRAHLAGILQAGLHVEPIE